MKPKDFKPLCSWEKRKPLLEEGLFHIPEYFQDHEQFSFPHPKELFPSDAPLHVEFCSGNGHWLIEKAKTTAYNWMAVEIRYDRVAKIVSKIHNEKLTNIFVVWGDARLFLKHYLAAKSVSAAYINFPDPWPKRRHEKHRLINKEFLDNLARVLVPEGKTQFVSDDQTYIERARQQFASHGAYMAPSCLPLPSDYGSSTFEKLWKEEGRLISSLEVVTCPCV